MGWSHHILCPVDTGNLGGKLKAPLLASSPNRWLLGRSQRLRYEACEVSAAMHTVTTAAGAEDPPVGPDLRALDDGRAGEPTF